MVLLYSCVITFNTFSSTITIDLWLSKRFPHNTLEKNQELAGDLMAIPYMIATFLFPLFGYVIILSLSFLQKKHINYT
jgi:hypothetical protein